MVYPDVFSNMNAHVDRERRPYRGLETVIYNSCQRLALGVMRVPAFAKSSRCMQPRDL